MNLVSLQDTVRDESMNTTHPSPMSVTNKDDDDERHFPHDVEEEDKTSLFIREENEASKTLTMPPKITRLFKDDQVVVNKKKGKADKAKVDNVMKEHEMLEQVEVIEINSDTGSEIEELDVKVIPDL